LLGFLYGTSDNENKEEEDPYKKGLNNRSPISRFFLNLIPIKEPLNKNMELQVLIQSDTTQAELELVFNNFLQELEENKLSFGGGLNENGIDGVVDASASGMNRAQLVDFLETFVLMNDIFSGLSYKKL
jgi:hypothetical protein